MGLAEPATLAARMAAAWGVIAEDAAADVHKFGWESDSLALQSQTYLQGLPAIRKALIEAELAANLLKLGVTPVLEEGLPVDAREMLPVVNTPEEIEALRALGYAR